MAEHGGTVLVLKMMESDRNFGSSRYLDDNTSYSYLIYNEDLTFIQSLFCNRKTPSPPSGSISKFRVVHESTASLRRFVDKA